MLKTIKVECTLSSEKYISLFSGCLIASYINESVDPCDDFYGFVCGKWKQANPIPAGETNIGTFQMLSNNVANALGGE